MAKKKPDPKPRAAASEVTPAPAAPVFPSGKKIGRPQGSKNRPKKA
jgi:hypothetical protein